MLESEIRTRRAYAGVGVLLATLLVVVVWTAVGGAYCPRLIVDDSVAADFRLVAVRTWDRFLAAFWARRDCFGDVTLRAARSLGSRAAYDPILATVTVRVPGTRAMLQGALVHEWAHHVEFQCAEHLSLRPAFLAAQDLPPGTPWRPHDRPAEIPASMWAEIPSEQYAEAAIMFVLGSRQIATHARFSQEALAVLGRWAAGENPSLPEGGQSHD
jgi:hypothetical protein